MGSGKTGRISVVVVVAAAMVASTAAASAEEKPANYVNVRVGVFEPTGDTKDGGYKRAENVEVIFGHYFSRSFALEGGFHRFRAKYAEVVVVYMEQFLEANGAVLTPKIIYPVGRFELYGGIGVGYYWVKNEIWVHGPFETTNTEPKDTIWGYHVVAGASYDLTRRWYLELEGKYVTLLDFLGATDITGVAVTLGVGLRF